jgi:hypothetical protein
MLPFRVLPRPILDIRAGLPPFPPSPAPRASHSDDCRDRLQISYAQNSNGRLYPFSFQSLALPSSLSSSNGKLRIPLIFLPLRTCSSQRTGIPPPPSSSKVYTFLLPSEITRLPVADFYLPGISESGPVGEISVSAAPAPYIPQFRHSG